MMTINFDYSWAKTSLDEDLFQNCVDAISGGFDRIINSYKNDEEEVLGWMEPKLAANIDLLQQIETKAAEIREEGEVFLLIGVGGSNQGARAVIESLGDNKVEIIYIGNNLSAGYMRRVLERIEGKSVFANVIAKNFETLEPGICFRIIRQYMENRYGESEAGKRIIATGTDGSRLNEIANKKGYLFLPFPKNIGGRFSVVSAVGLMPMAVQGIDIRALVEGAEVVKEASKSDTSIRNDIISYSALRSTLNQQGKDIEMMVAFEPELTYFQKWWLQLFGESEGKEGRGLFPVSASYSEDLHAIGQYVQEGKPVLFETFLNIESPEDKLQIQPDKLDDGFGYLDGKDFNDLNEAAYEATLQAHTSGGVPVSVLNVPNINAHFFGQLFYFFELCCYTSADHLQVNPFDQPGVEAYKKNMFKKLGK